ncbi:MAG TPA: acyltransferase [Terracidiphilus sp.]|nr:acyltransferase [Terracidiphilus sp.]
MRMANASSSAPHPAPEAEEIYRRWIAFLDDEFTRHQSAPRRAEVVRDQLYQLYLGRPHGGKLNLTLTSELPGNVVSLSLDPENVTLEAGHFADVDRDKFDKLKPLLWFWQMFDRSPVGLNHWLGLRFRCMLGRHLFAHMGTGVKIYHGVDLTYGYNLSIGDGVTIRQRALLNDRGGISIGDHAIIGSYSRIFSHAHDPADYDKVRLVPTKIGHRARIASHAIVLAGQHVGEGESVGTFPTDRI